MQRHHRPDHQRTDTRGPQARERAPQRPSFYPLTLRGERNEIACRYYAHPGAQAAAVWVGTTDEWDSPARALYPRLCERLQEEGIASLRVCLHRPRDLAHCIADIHAGIHYLSGQGIARLALIGHGRGATAVIHAAVGLRFARTVIALAAEGGGAEAIERLGPRCSLLLLHGDDDRVAPVAGAQAIYEFAREPKELLRYAGTGHDLDEVADGVGDTVHAWITGELLT